MTEAVEGRVEVRWRGQRLGLHYREWPGPGRPILLLHGLASSARIWDQVAARLAPRWRVVALDQRGHGRSDKPTADYGFGRVVADARAVAAALGLDRPLVVGHSWGGNVALHYAVAPGGAPRHRPRALALVDGGFLELSRRMTWPEARVRLRPPDLDMPLAAFRARMRERLGDRWSPAWESATLANFWVDVDGSIRRNLAIPNHMRILRALYRHRPSELFGQVGCPVLLVRAEPPGQGDPDQRRARDEEIGLAEAALTGRVPFRTVRMADTVHDVPLHRPDELAALLDGWADRPDG